MWLKNRFLQKLGGGWVESFGLRPWAKLQFASLSARKDPAAIELMRGIQQEKRSLMSAFEQYIVYGLAKSQSRKYDGAFAEVGVFKGASAKLICEVKEDKTLHLFDTFEGLPEASKEDRSVHQKGQYAYGLEDVQQYLSDYDNVQYHKGLFPDSVVDVPDQQYAFVHFDVDLYEGTLACLEYFYPKMTHGGVMLSHDYGILAGVEQAFTEFFDDKPEEVIDLPTTQCLVFKL